jgi:hypothetical protein
MSNGLRVAVALVAFFGVAAGLALGLRLAGTAVVWLGGLLFLTVVLVLQAAVGGHVPGYVALLTAVALVVVTAAVEIAAWIEGD